MLGILWARPYYCEALPLVSIRLLRALSPVENPIGEIDAFNPLVKQARHKQEYKLADQPQVQHSRSCSMYASYSLG